MPGSRDPIADAQEDAIARLTLFLDPRLFAAFGLPAIRSDLRITSIRNRRFRTNKRVTGHRGRPRTQDFASQTGT